MGFLNSAYDWLHGKLNTGLLAGPAPANMSLNSSPSHSSSPIKMNLNNPDPIKVYNPYVSSFVSGVDPSSGDSVNPSAMPYKPSAHGLSRSKLAEVDYINAELAKHYGMSKSTAYQEALSNTSYQRAVKDMQAAGLNPSVMFGSGRAQGASSSVYASAARSGGGYSARRGSGSSGNNQLFSPGTYYGISTAVGLATALLTKNFGNYWIGSSSAQGVMGAMNAALKK